MCTEHTEARTVHNEPIHLFRCLQLLNTHAPALLTTYRQQHNTTQHNITNTTQHNTTRCTHSVCIEFEATEMRRLKQPLGNNTFHFK